MGFRLRRSARLGPLRFQFTASGLSSISLSGRGASLNLPVNRRGGPRVSIGLPGTGLSWSVEPSAPQAPRRIGGSRREGRLPHEPAPATGVPDPLPPAMQTSADRAPAPARTDADRLQRTAADLHTAATPAASPGAATLPNSRRLRPSQLQALSRHCRQLFEQQLYRAGSEPRRLWEEGLVSRMLGDPAMG